MKRLLTNERPLTAEERRMVLRAIVALAIPLAFIVLLIGVAGFLVYRHEANQRISNNREAIMRNEELRISFDRRIAQLVYDQCVLGETRDVILVGQLEAAKRNTLRAVAAAKREGRPVDPELVQDVLDGYDDGINALEPEDEQDCAPPEADRPEATP